MPSYYIEYDLIPTRAIWNATIVAPTPELAWLKLLQSKTERMRPLHKLRKVIQLHEHILVIPEDRLSVLGGATGYIPGDRATLDYILDKEHMQFLERNDELEANPSFKQLIPYMIFTYTDEDDGVRYVFQYTRTKQQGESRLHSKRSIGIGGHVNQSDVGSDEDYQTNPFWAGARREREEEVKVIGGWNGGVHGNISFLYDPSNAVGQVHLGVVVVYDMHLPAILARERSMANAGFVELSQLVEEKDQFENWSQLCIDHLIKTANEV